MILLYRAGLLPQSPLDAPGVAQKFDATAQTLNLKGHTPRSEAAFFCRTPAEALRWAGWRLNEGLDASIWAYEVPDSVAAVNYYQVPHYNRYVAALSRGEDGAAEVKDYYDTSLTIDSGTVGSLSPCGSVGDTAWEALIPLGEALTWGRRLVKEISPL